MGYASPERGGWALDLSHSDTSPLLVSGVIEHYPAGHEVPRHSHHRGHLLYATEGARTTDQYPVSEKTGQRNPTCTG
jgi:hypothetical protein